MIKLMEGLPENVIGFEAVGTVEAADYDDILEPVVRAADEAHEKLRMLYVLGEDFEGYSGGAMWEDTKLGVGNWTSFERIAVVTDHAGYRHAVNAFGWLLPGKVKTFDLGDLDDAIEWVGDDG